MEIRKASMSDIHIILKLYENARSFMTGHGNPTQWGNTYPSKVLIENDIQTGCSYVCEEHGEIIAAFFYHFGRDDIYEKIYGGQWLDESPYGSVHRITSNGTIKGAASFCLNWALEQCGSLKIDTHKDNTIMQHVLEKNRFIYCGTIYLEDGSERMAYQKKL